MRIPTGNRYDGRPMGCLLPATALTTYGTTRGQAIRPSGARRLAVSNGCRPRGAATRGLKGLTSYWWSWETGPAETVRPGGVRPSHRGLRGTSSGPVYGSVRPSCPPVPVSTIISITTEGPVQGGLGRVFTMVGRVVISNDEGQRVGTAIRVGSATRPTSYGLVSPKTASSVCPILTAIRRSTAMPTDVAIAMATIVGPTETSLVVSISTGSGNVDVVTKMGPIISGARHVVRSSGLEVVFRLATTGQSHGRRAGGLIGRPETDSGTACCVRVTGVAKIRVCLAHAITGLATDVVPVFSVGRGRLTISAT